MNIIKKHGKLLVAIDEEKLHEAMLMSKTPPTLKKFHSRNNVFVTSKNNVQEYLKKKRLS
jgi:hypothetical protein